MHTILWILQIILGIKLLSVAHSHGLRQSQPTMQDAVQRLGRVATFIHYGIAICAFAGAVGLILPGVLGSPARITSAIAIFLSILWLSSIPFHVRTREKPTVFASVILFVLTVFVAYGRWGFTP